MSQSGCAETDEPASNDPTASSGLPINSNAYIAGGSSFSTSTPLVCNEDVSGSTSLEQASHLNIRTFSPLPQTTEVVDSSLPSSTRAPSRQDCKSDAGKPAGIGSVVTMIPSNWKPLSVSKEPLCNHPFRLCRRPCIPNHEFCLDHILIDQSAHYKPCAYMSNRTGKNCSKVGLRPDKRDSFCQPHANKLLAAKKKRYIRSHRKPDRRALLSKCLKKYATNSKVGVDGAVSTPPPMPPYLPPSDVLDGESSGEEVGDCVQLDDRPVDSFWTVSFEGEDMNLNPDADDPLKNAGIYTADEATQILRTKLIRLQYLYKEQFRWLEHRLKQQAAEFQRAKKEEKATGRGIPFPVDLNDLHEYEVLRAARRYKTKQGAESLLKRQLKAKRRIMLDSLSLPPQQTQASRCCYVENNHKCCAVALPCTRFCSKHIVRDPNQILFHACPVAAGEKSCPEVVCDHLLDQACFMHRTLPPLFSPTKEHGSSPKSTSSAVPCRPSVYGITALQSQAPSNATSTQSSKAFSGEGGVEFIISGSKPTSVTAKSEV